MKPISFVYVELVWRVAMGMLREDAEEMARGLRCIRPQESFRTHILGSAWLCYGLLLAQYWGPHYASLLLDEAPEMVRVYNYERLLRAGVRELSVWKICRQQVGIAHVLMPKRTPEVVIRPSTYSTNWECLALAALVLIAVCLVPAPTHLFSIAAFVPFYIDTGGHDMNAGTVINAGPTIGPVTNGSWDITADTFIGTSGVEFAAAVVNDYASIYIDGTTSGAVYVAQIVSVGALGVSITLSTTAKYGTKPSASATARSCRVGGSWLSELPIAAAGMATTTVSTSVKVNIKGTITLSLGRTIGWKGATTTPLWLSGYNTTPGDLDADLLDTLTKPVWACTTFLLQTNGIHQYWSNFSITSTRTTNAFASSGTVCNFVRVWFVNTAADAGAFAVSGTGNGSRFTYCYFSAPTTGTATGVVNIGTTGWVLIGCTAAGGGLSCFAPIADTLIDCVAINGTVGIGVVNTNLQVFNPTIYNMSSDGIKWTTGFSSTPASTVVGGLFSKLGGAALNNATGTNTNLIVRVNNDKTSTVTSADIGFGDAVDWFVLTDTGDIVTSGTDMTPAAGANARSRQILFTNQAYSTYRDIGAVRHVDPAAGGSGYAGGVFGG